MNKYENAILNIRYANDRRYIVKETDLQCIEELVERATPKKPIEMVIEEKYSEIYVVYQCPNCKKELFSATLISDNRFCRNCGQATDWSKE